MAWAPSYVTTVQLRDYLRISDSVDDVALGSAIGAASRAIDQACNRQFGLATAVENRFYTASYDRGICRWTVPIDDLMTVTGLLVGTDPLGDLTFSASVTGSALRPVNAVANGRPWTSLVVPSTSAVQPTLMAEGVRVTGRFGWTTVPEVIQSATLLQASRIFARRDAPFGVAGSIDQGSEMRLLSRIDPDVEVMLRGYRKLWGAV